MSGTTYYQRNKEVILNRAKDYYESSKESLREREQKISIANYLRIIWPNLAIYKAFIIKRLFYLLKSNH